MRQQIEPVANGEVRIVVEVKKPDRHNVVLTKSMYIDLARAKSEALVDVYSLLTRYKIV